MIIISLALFSMANKSLASYLAQTSAKGVKQNYLESYSSNSAYAHVVVYNILLELRKVLRNSSGQVQRELNKVT